MVLLVIFVMLQILIAVKEKVVSWPKILFCASNVTWLFIGLMMSDADPRLLPKLFFLIHGVAYFVFIQKTLADSRNEVSATTEARAWIYVLALGFVGIFWGLVLRVGLNGPYADLLLPFLHTPLLTHYAFDSVIWRKAFRTEF